MTQISVEKDTALSRISAIVDRLLHSKSVYEDLDKQEMLEIFSKLLEEVLPAEVLSLNDEQYVESERPRFRKLVVG